MSTFLDALNSGRVLLMDGAMGTELQRLGLKPGERAAVWNVEHPERVKSVHHSYHAAGAEVFLTNTFLAALVPFDTVRSGILLTPPFRVLALGPVGGSMSEREFERPSRLGVSRAVIDDPDAILLEACSSPRARYAVDHLRRNENCPPILLSLTYRHVDHGELVTFTGHSPEWFAERASRWGVAALGVNCGRDISVADCAEIVRRYRRVTDLPLFARPNAGTPKKVRGKWVYPLTPQALAEQVPELLEAGVCMVGGCCGTAPEHIAALRPIVDRYNRRRG